MLTVLAFVLPVLVTIVFVKTQEGNPNYFLAGVRLAFFLASVTFAGFILRAAMWLVHALTGASLTAGSQDSIYGFLDNVALVGGACLALHVFLLIFARLFYYRAKTTSS